MRLPHFTAVASLGSTANDFICASAESASAARGVITAQSSFNGSCPASMSPVECCLLQGGRMECHELQGHVHCECVR
jgi:hypothetical protein